MYSMSRTMYNMPRTVFSMPRTVFSMPRTVFSMPRTVFSMPHTMYSMPRIMYSMPRTKLTMQRVVYDNTNTRTYFLYLYFENSVETTIFDTKITNHYKICIFKPYFSIVHLKQVVVYFILFSYKFTG